MKKKLQFSNKNFTFVIDWFEKVQIIDYAIILLKLWFLFICDDWINNTKYIEQVIYLFVFKENFYLSLHPFNANDNVILLNIEINIIIISLTILLTIINDNFIIMNH